MGNQKGQQYTRKALRTRRTDGVLAVSTTLSQGIERMEDVIIYDLTDTDTSFAEIYKEYELEHQHYAKGRYKIPKQAFANYLKSLGFTKVTASTKKRLTMKVLPLLMMN